MVICLTNAKSSVYYDFSNFEEMLRDTQFVHVLLQVSHILDILNDCGIIVYGCVTTVYIYILL